MKILLEVRGGIVESIIADDDCQIVIIDWDNINQNAPFTNDVYEPDRVIRGSSIVDKLDVDIYSQDIISKLQKIDF